MARADYDLVIASQAYRARAPLDFTAERVVAPLARSLRAGGRGRHAGDPLGAGAGPGRARAVAIGRLGIAAKFGPAPHAKSV